MAGAGLSGGFAEPVLAAQGTFRTIMDALARPGRVQPLAAHLKPPAPLSPELAAIALTLVDHETPIWLAEPLLRRAEVRRWLAFHTGAPLVDAPEDAAFAFAPDLDALPSLSAFPRGTAEYPDAGATVVVAVTALQGGQPVKLSGPGLREMGVFAPEGPQVPWWSELMATRSFYPLGIDVLFAATGGIAGLPRSTRIELMEEPSCMSR